MTTFEDGGSDGEAALAVAADLLDRQLTQVWPSSAALPSTECSTFGAKAKGMANSELERAFDLVVDAAWKGLKPLGYRKQGRKFRKLGQGNLALIEFQRSTTSDAGLIKFTLNLGVVSTALAQAMDPERDSKKLGVWEAHLRQRIGSLMPNPHDHWWLLTAATDAQALAQEVAALVVETAAPYLDRHLSDDTLLALWRTGQSPGLTGAQSQRYLSLLAQRAV